MAKQPPRKIAPLDGKIAPLKKKSNLGNGKIAPLSFEIQVKFSQNSSPQRFVAKSLLFFVATFFLHIFLPIQPIYFLCNDCYWILQRGYFAYRLIIHFLPMEKLATFFVEIYLGELFCIINNYNLGQGSYFAISKNRFFFQGSYFAIQGSYFAGGLFCHPGELFCCTELDGPNGIFHHTTVYISYNFQVCETHLNR